MLNIYYDDIIYKWNMYMILIICEIIELRLYVVFNGWYVMYDSCYRFTVTIGALYGGLVKSVQHATPILGSGIPGTLA